MTKQWPDGVNLVLGLWLIIAPFTMQHSLAGSAAYNAYIAGLLIAAVSLGALTAFQMWEEWANLILGFWLLISPWTLGFTSSTAATWNQAIVGLLVIVFAIWQITIMGGQRTQSA